ncbi:C40 family peptidase [Pseudomonas sp. PDM19]|nr:C40 family peptidase [Pseudomonas sp. PDM19]
MRGSLGFPFKSLHQVSAGDSSKLQISRQSFVNVKSLPKSESASESRHRIIRRAKELIGTAYKWGGVSEVGGFDCSGFLVYLFRSEVGVELPRTTSSMIRENYQRVSRDKLQPGDAVFFTQNGSNRANHVGIYIGENRFIHAPRTGESIRIDSLNNNYWNSRFFGARRFEVEKSS